jgi:hypothetical protein
MFGRTPNLIFSSLLERLTEMSTVTSSAIKSFRFACFIAALVWLLGYHTRFYCTETDLYPLPGLLLGYRL